MAPISCNFNWIIGIQIDLVGFVFNLILVMLFRQSQKV